MGLQAHEYSGSIGGLQARAFFLDAEFAPTLLKRKQPS
jgi:hypothetical protein